MLIGLESCQDEDLVLAAYNDNGSIFGTVDHQPLRHKFVAEARRPIQCPTLGLTFEAGDRIFTLESYKYKLRDIINHFTAGGLEVRAMWRANAAPVYQYLLAKHEPRAAVEESVIDTLVSDRPVAPVGDNAVATTA
ncbi:hypothetical protein VPNG_00954 [Cytospora leucostoma]|uniref:Histidine-specific methyltransferase SAM-dependent domain-containing protein n=1 Tax=Cytospora leucostoma TaxID=1230097 RepID=A0A423XMG9_9PEZI|nr:hypothetical protein VPNG_00954 [Cytospora leucostoma]